MRLFAPWITHSVFVVSMFFGGVSWRSDAADEPSSTAPNTNNAIARIRKEGFDNSKVMEFMSQLTEVIGPRLTGSPQLKRANEYTRDAMTAFGMTNAHLESWGPFGQGWSVQKFSLQVSSPFNVPLIGYPKAWSPGFDKPIEAEAVWIESATETNLAKYKDKIKGKFVLYGSPRELRVPFEAQATRRNDTNLLDLANASPPRGGGRGGFVGRGEGGGPRGGRSSGTNAPVGAFTNTLTGAARMLTFVMEQKAAALITPSSQGEAGILFVAQASVPGAGRGGAGRGGRGQGADGTNAPARPSSAWNAKPGAMPVQITLAPESYNRLAHMLKAGEKLKLSSEMQVKFHDKDPMAYNTIAEIPGTDLKDEIVMIGAHLDSWHSGTGATDNAAGCATMMEAARILTAQKFPLRRTVRVGLWTGEEQGLLGSRAYVSNHFGYYGVSTNRPSGEGRGGGGLRQLVKKQEYEKLSAYYNFDNGTGKIRGVYMQGNEAVRPLFRQWLQPFRDLDAGTLTISGTGGTDHLSFDDIGLPGFQFIQDPIDYWTRTHHSNMDVIERIIPEDLKQSAIIIAAFVYETAMRDKPLPRKSVEGN